MRYGKLLVKYLRINMDMLNLFTINILLVSVIRLSNNSNLWVNGNPSKIFIKIIFKLYTYLVNLEIMTDVSTLNSRSLILFKIIAGGNRPPAFYWLYSDSPKILKVNSVFYKRVVIFFPQSFFWAPTIFVLPTAEVELKL